MLEKIVREVGDIRYGAECYGPCLLAAGHIDVVLDVGVDAQHVQPLIPIVEAAGGRISDWEGNACYTGGNILACGDPAMHDRLLRSLNSYM